MLKVGFGSEAGIKSPDCEHVVQHNQLGISYGEISKGPPIRRITCTLRFHCGNHSYLNCMCRSYVDKRVTMGSRGALPIPFTLLSMCRSRGARWMSSACKKYGRQTCSVRFTVLSKTSTPTLSVLLTLVQPRRPGHRAYAHKMKSMAMQGA
jgi:hypothetical protein